MSVFPTELEIKLYVDLTKEPLFSNFYIQMYANKATKQMCIFQLTMTKETVKTTTDNEIPILVVSMKFISWQNRITFRDMIPLIQHWLLVVLMNEEEL